MKNKKLILKLAHNYNFKNSEVRKLNFNIPMYQLNLCVETKFPTIEAYRLFYELEDHGFRIFGVGQFYSEKKHITGIGFEIMTKTNYKKLKQKKIKVSVIK